MSWYQLNKNNFLKVSNLTLLFFILVCGLSYICFTTPLRQANQTNEQTRLSRRYTPSKPRVEIIGLKYDLDSKGEKSLQLKADRFVIRKKKLGLIRFGLAQEALFENAQFSFFFKKKSVPMLDKSNHTLTSPFKLQEANVSEPAKNNILYSLNEILTSFDAKRISSLVMAPINIIFYNENSKASQVYAKSASLDLRRKEIVLSGDVRMTAGEKHIKTNKLLFLPETEEFYIPGNFLLEINGVKKTKEPIISDILLNVISL